MISRKTISSRLISVNEHFFACPICTNRMKLVESARLICDQRHSFDLSKHGYINLLSRNYKTKYDKRLFEARKQISDSGLFQPLINSMYEALWNNKPPSPSHAHFSILDAGCGEGSLLASLQHHITAHTQHEPISVGIDIAKEAIALASKNNVNAIWCVADLANCPFADEQFDVILNILSPSNYAEFNRMLKKDGVVLKVVPESQYLKELREMRTAGTDVGVARKKHANNGTLQLFKQSFSLVHTDRIQYEFTLDQNQLDHLVQMTPLSWRIPQDVLELFVKQSEAKITFDFAILLGKKREATS